MSVSKEESGRKSLDYSEVKKTNRTLQKLFTSIETGNIVVLEQTLRDLMPLQRSSLFSKFNDEGYNLLHMAIKKKNAAMVMTLIDLGADMNAITGEAKPHTPMELAVISRDDGVIDLLLDRIPHAVALKGHLAQAILTEKEEYARKLLDRLANKEWYERRIGTEGWGEDSVAAIAKVGSVEDGSGKAYTALDEAVRKGDLEMVRRILAIPAFRQRIHDEGREGRSAIHWACFLGNEAIYRELAQYADSDLLASDGGTILHHAVLGGNKNLAFIQFLLAIRGFPERFLNKLDDKGRSPLYNACQLGADELIEELCVNQKALLDRVNNVSPLHIACQNGDVATTRKLLQYYPDIAENWLRGIVLVDGEYKQDITLDTPFESAVTVELRGNAPANIVASQEELLSFLHRRMREDKKEVDPLMDFKRNIFLSANHAIAAIPDSDLNNNLKTAMKEMYNCLSHDYQDVVEEEPPQKRQKIIARNTKILCLTRQLHATAERFALGKGTKQEIASDFQSFCASKTYSDKVSNAVFQVIGAIIGAVVLGAVGLAIGFAATGGIGAPITAAAGAIKGVVAGATAGIAVAGAAAAVVGAAAGAVTVRQFRDSMKLQMCIWRVNRECSKQTKIPLNNLVRQQHPGSHPESEMTSQLESASEEQRLTTDSSSR